jgi:hypothetical protein
MRRTRTPAENFMLANAYLDIVEGLMTREEATAYLCANYEGHPSPRSVSNYLGAARKSYESLIAARGRARKKSASSGLDFEMRLAVDQRAGD